MPGAIVLLVDLATGLVALATTAHRRQPPIASAVTSFALVVDAALMVAYVLGDDSYRHDGTSRWDAYRSPGGALGPLFVATIAVVLLLAVALQVARRQAPRAIPPIAALAALTCLLVGIPVIVGFTAN